MELEDLMKSIEEELEEWESQGKPEWPHFDWRWEVPVYTLYEEVKRLQEYEWMYKDLCD